MKNPNEIAAEVAARIQAEKDEELGAAIEGAQKLTDLRVALESLNEDYGALFDDSPTGEERGLWIQQGGRLVAKWTRMGRTLVFQPERQAPREASDVEQAVAVTVEFLLRRRNAENQATGGGRLAASRRGLAGWSAR